MRNAHVIHKQFLYQNAIIFFFFPSGDSMIRVPSLLIGVYARELPVDIRPERQLRSSLSGGISDHFYHFQN